MSPLALSAALVAAIAGCALDVEFDPVSEDEIATVDQAVTTPTLIKPSLAVNSTACTAATLRVGNAPGKVRKFELRRRKDGRRWTTVLRETPNGSGLLTDSYLLPFDALYEYSVRARYRDGSSRWSDPVQVQGARCDVPLSRSGTTHTLHIIPVTTSDRPLPFSRAQLDEYIFGRGAAQPSAAEFFEEISAGYQHTRFIPSMRLGGRVEDWIVLPRRRAIVEADCPGVATTCSPLDAFLKSARAWQATNGVDYETGADIYLYVFDTSAAGGGFSGPRPMVDASTFTHWADRPYGSAVHELSHVLLLYPEHTAADCTAGGGFPYPLTENRLRAACRQYEYGNPSSFMSGVAGAAHPSGFFKAQNGFLTGRIQWLNATSEGEPGSDPFPRGTSVEFDLHDSTSQHGRNALQLLIVKLEADDTSYMIDYRRAVGLNAIAGTRSTGQQPFPEGVYVELRPGRDVGQSSDTRTLQPTTADQQPIIATPSTPYGDPARGIVVSVVADHDSWVRVRLERH